MAATTAKRTAWWRDAIIYQIWPKSFYSGRGTATGDIAGIIAKLDYIKSLGVNTIWVSPHYASPMIDEGYDVADYEAINPLFGDVSDAEQLIKECHKRDLRVLFDLVVNHTSDQHKWFQESRSSKDNPKRGWYIWRPAKYDENGQRKPPNNWSSCFSQSAWTWDEKTQEYYLHLFAVEQPDLNWENLEMRKAVYKSAMEFWLERGVNGFRVDTVNMYSKPDLRDAPVTDPKKDIQPAGDIFCNGPQMDEILHEMGAILGKYDAMTVGETPHTQSKQRILDYVSFKNNELSMVFQFDAVDLGKKPNDILLFKPWTLLDLKKITEEWQTFIDGNDGWTTSFLENHDQGRSVSRFASDKPEHHDASSKMLALLTTCSSGTPFIYQGQEIGMTNVPLSWDEKEYLDINTINYLARRRKDGATEEDIKKIMPDINLHARDNGRTPVQWSDEPNAGFTKPDVKTWMRVNDNYPKINAAQQLKDPDSIWHFWQKALTLRKHHPALFTYGHFKLFDESNPNIFGFTKTKHDDAPYTAAVKVQASKDPQTALVLLNFSDKAQKFDLSSLGSKGSQAQLALSSAGAKEAAASLEPYEGRVLLL